LEINSSDEISDEVSKMGKMNNKRVMV